MSNHSTFTSLEVLRNYYPTTSLGGISYPAPVPGGNPLLTNNPDPIWTAAEIAEATGGKWVQGDIRQLAMTGVEYNFTRLREGYLFIPREAEHWDKKPVEVTKKFLLKAQKQGAVAFVVTKIPEGLPKHIPVLLVPNTRKALFDIGRYARRRFQGKVICVTGSVGKTTTKEMIRFLLAQVEPTVGSPRNLNTMPGVAVNFAQTAPDISYAAFEFGVGMPAKTLPKAKMCNPHVAIVTEIYEAHLSFYKTQEKVAEQKALLFDALTAGGTVILNRDANFFELLYKLAKDKGVQNIVTYGSPREADICLSSYQTDPAGSDVEIMVQGRTIRYRLGMPGFHHVRNSMAALAAVMVVGEDIDLAAQNLSSYRLENRTEYYEVERAGGSFTIIDDVYNANPGSVGAGLKLIPLIEHGIRRRRLVVLGQMKNPGEETDRLHRELSIPLMDVGVDKVYTLGEDMLHLRNALPPEMRGLHGKTYEDICDDLLNEVRAGDIVFLKGPAPSPENTKLLVDKLRGIGFPRIPRVVPDLDLPLNPQTWLSGFENNTLVPYMSH